MSIYNPFDVSIDKEKKSIWSNPTTPMDISQLKNEPIKSTAKPLDLNIKPDTSEANLPFDATKAGILRNTVLGIPKAAKDMIFPTRGYKEEDLRKAKPSFTQNVMAVPKVAAEVFGGITELGNMTVGEYLSDIKSLQKFTETKVGGKIADIGVGVRSGVEKLYKYSQPKNVEEASAMRIADVGTLFIGNLKLGGTSASLIAKTKNSSKIFNILKAEVPNITDDGANVLSKILTNVDNVDDVQKVINRTNFAINNGKDITPPTGLTVKPTEPIKPKSGQPEPIKPSVTKTQVKGMVKAMGGDVNFKVVEEGGQKYLGFFDGKTDIMLKPTALGITDDSVEVGQMVNINSENLKPKGTRFSVEEVKDNPFDVVNQNNQVIEKPTIQQEVKKFDSDPKGILFRFYDEVPLYKNADEFANELSGSVGTLPSDISRMSEVLPDGSERYYRGLRGDEFTNQAVKTKNLLSGVEDPDLYFSKDFGESLRYANNNPKNVIEVVLKPEDVKKIRFSGDGEYSFFIERENIDGAIIAKEVKIPSDEFVKNITDPEVAKAELKSFYEQAQQPTSVEKPQPLFSGQQKPPVQEVKTQKEDFLPELDQPLVPKKESNKTYKNTIPEIGEEVYKQNRSGGSSKRTFMQTSKENIGSIQKGADKILGVISTRLKNLDISLKREIRKFEYELSQKTTKDNNAITPYMKKTKKLSPADYADLDLALKNRDSKKIDQIIKYNNLEKEFGDVRKTLDGLYKRATDIGFEINYVKNYFPREVDNPIEFLKYLEKENGWKEIDQTIKNKEEELGRYLNENEKASIADSFIVSGEKILVQVGGMKPRTIDFIGSDINRFYKDSNVALNNYIQTMNDATESWKFFNLDSKVNKYTKLDNTIGSYVFKKLNDGVITPEQSTELTNILKARFADVGTSGFTSLYKNLSYIDTMGSPISALTQIGDLGFSLYRSGPFRTGKEMAKSLFGKSAIKRSDIGIDKIAQEFSEAGTTAKALNLTFKATGLEKIDAIGKEALINSVISKYRKQALNPTPDFMRRIGEVFENETPQVIADLKSGNITENVKYLAFNELLDIQPLKLSEMPEQYLKGGNGRIFYMLKTYTIKLFDVYRNEVFQEIKRNKISGIRNLIYLTGALVTANATADEIKDFVLGRETSFSDRVVDNLLRLVGFSKWTIYKARMEGLASATIKTILPPTKFLDSLYKDITKEKEIKDLEVIQSVPLLGKLYYWWFGKGAEKSKDKKKNLGSRSF